MALNTDTSEVSGEYTVGELAGASRHTALAVWLHAEHQEGAVTLRNGETLWMITGCDSLSSP